jgi:hypothetical protein
MTLRNAIDKDQFYIENISYSDDDLKAMSSDELETLKMLIQKKKDGLNLALKEKQDDSFNAGKKRALYINQRAFIYVSYLIKNRRQQKTTLTDYFFEHAMAMLPTTLFEQILYEAQTSIKALK